jgi:hypothetical protein
VPACRHLDADLLPLAFEVRGLMPPEMKRLKQLEQENGRLRKLVADLSLKGDASGRPAPKNVRPDRNGQLVDAARTRWIVSVRMHPPNSASKRETGKVLKPIGPTSRFRPPSDNVRLVTAHSHSSAVGNARGPGYPVESFTGACIRSTLFANPTGFTRPCSTSRTVLPRRETNATKIKKISEYAILTAEPAMR